MDTDVGPGVTPGPWAGAGYCANTPLLLRSDLPPSRCSWKASSKISHVHPGCQRRGHTRPFDQSLEYRTITRRETTLEHTFWHLIVGRAIWQHRRNSLITHCLLELRHMKHRVNGSWRRKLQPVGDRTNTLQHAKRAEKLEGQLLISSRCK